MATPLDDPTSSTRLYGLSAGTRICTFNGRGYYSVNGGYAYIAIVNNIDGQWKGFILVSEDANAVVYRADSGGPFNAAGSITMYGKTYYYSANEHFWAASSNYSNTAGLNLTTTYSETSMKDVAIHLINDVYVAGGVANE